MPPRVDVREGIAQVAAMRRPALTTIAALLITMLVGQQAMAATPLWELRAEQRAKKQAKNTKQPKTQPAPEPTRITSEMERVMGKEARNLIQLFGQPTQDVREASARKLQFSSDVCILDAYLYVPTEGGDPVVTYVSARVADGRDAERNSCITALRQKR